ncbi:hypothetical protein ES705_50191 [subsurface metagenome]|jgi:hypothetical protein
MISKTIVEKDRLSLSGVFRFGMSLSVTPSLWPRRIAANNPSQDLADLSTKQHVEGLNFPVHPERIQILTDIVEM